VGAPLNPVQLVVYVSIFVFGSYVPVIVAEPLPLTAGTIWLPLALPLMVYGFVLLSEFLSFLQLAKINALTTTTDATKKNLFVTLNIFFILQILISDCFCLQNVSNLEA
jgi:hypothetical protein